MDKPKVWEADKREAFWAEVFRIQKADTKYKSFIPDQRYKRVGGHLVAGMVVVVQAVEMFWVDNKTKTEQRWRKRRGHKPRAYTVVSFDPARALLIATPNDVAKKRKA